MKAIIIGAGFAGLTAAYRLKQAGWDAVVLEATDHPGGRVQSQHKDGYTIEMGATTLSTGFGEYMRLCRELGMQSEIVEFTSLVLVMRAGRVFPIDAQRPLSALFSPVLSLRGKLALVRAAKDFIGLRPRMNPLDVSACHMHDVESAQTYAERRLTREVYDFLIDPLIRTYVLRRGDNASKLEWFSALANLIGQRMMGLRGGLQRMPLQLAQKLDVRLNSPVTSVVRAGAGVQINYRDSQGDHCEGADACVIATRLPEAAALFPEFADKARPLMAKLPYNKVLCVHLGYRIRTTIPAIGVLIPTIEDGNFSLIWCDSNKNPETAPPGHSLILAYFDAEVASRFYDHDDESLARIAQELVEKVFPELRGHRDMVFVSRVPLGIPHPTPGAYAAVHALKQQLDPDDRVQFAGDYFTCTGQNSAIYYGGLAAANVIKAF